MLLFHHDPLHTDGELDLLHRDASERWLALGRSPGELAMAVEGSEIELRPDGASYASDVSPRRRGMTSPASSST